MTLSKALKEVMEQACIYIYLGRENTRADGPEVEAYLGYFVEHKEATLTKAH